jgi:hypothetical protein
MKDVIGPLGAQVALIRKLNFSAGEETTLKFRAPSKPHFGFLGRSYDTSSFR